MEPHAARPAGSVIVPVRDGGAAFEAQLEALAAQDVSSPWELLIVDDGSTDDTSGRVERWRERLPACRLLTSGPPHGSGHARNTGAAAARAHSLLFCDADDVVAPGWLTAHLAALERHGVVTGTIVTETINDPATVASAPGAAFVDGPPVGNDFLPFALGANLGVRREVFDLVGGFDGDRRHGNDKVFCWSAALAGHPLHFAPEAVVHYRLRASGTATFRRQRSIARSAPSLFRRFQPHGMPRSSLRDAARDLLHLAGALPRLRSPEVRLAAARTAGRRVGRLEGSIRERVLYL